MSATGPARHEAEAVPSGFPDEASMPAGARGRATSVPNATPLPSILRAASPTQGDALARAQAAAERVSAVLSGVQSGVLVTSHPSSLADAHTRVHEAAGHWEALAVKVPRLLWGYGWLGFKALLHLLEWVTESPVRFIIAAVLVIVAWLFH